MRLWLSDKAAKALKEVPAAMKGLSEGQKPADAAPEDKEKKKAEDEAREAKKDAKKELREATGKADAELEEALDAAHRSAQATKDTEHRLAERRKDAKHGRAAVDDAQRRLEEAQAALERAKKAAARAEEQVPQLEAQLATATAESAANLERLQKALGAADEAWRAVHPRNRKKRDRRARHAAIQLVGPRQEDMGDEAEFEARAAAAQAAPPPADAAGPTA